MRFRYKAEYSKVKNQPKTKYPPIIPAAADIPIIIIG